MRSPSRNGTSPPAHAFTLIGKPDCHLCHVMRAVADKVLADFGAVLEERDVRSEAGLEALYRDEIPVLLMAGDREVARHRITEAELRERLIGLGLSPRPR